MPGLAPSLSGLEREAEAYEADAGSEEAWPSADLGQPGLDPSEYARIAQGHSQTWWFLSRFYLERPEKALLGELQAAFAAAAAWEPDGGDASDDVEVLVACLKEDLDGLSHRLLPEYTRLFRGIQEGLGPPPPFESVYRGEAPGGDLTLEVLAQYEAAGFGPVEPNVGPQDHLGAELRFLALLAFREAEAWNSGDETQALERVAHQGRFLDRHLLVWLPAYTERVARDSREPFYAAAARLTLGHAQRVRVDLDAIEAAATAA